MAEGAPRTEGEARGTRSTALAERDDAAAPAPSEPTRGAGALPYVPQIDGLRFFSFLAVFLFHVQPFRTWWGAYGVHLFFTLSGFLITWLLLASEGREGVGLGRTVGVFYVRRALRIFPAYYLVLLVVLPFGTLLFPAWHAAYLYNVRVFWESLTGNAAPLLANYKSSGSHFWSLCVEEQFYLLYPWLLLLVPRARRAWFLAGLVLFSMACRAWFAAFHPETLYGLLLPVCTEYLGWGALAALLMKEGRFPRIPNRLLLYGALLALLVLIALPRPEGARGVELQFQPGLAQTARALVFTALVVGLWRDDRSLPARVLRLAPLVYLGKISYGLYLFHLFTFEPYAALVRRYPDLALVDRRIALLALTIAIASLSWFLFERPLNRLKDRMGR
jgi:peptidoglycan/LPS O-acetylase OafA/YrhL